MYNRYNDLPRPPVEREAGAFGARPPPGPLGVLVPPSPRLWRSPSGACRWRSWPSATPRPSLALASTAALSLAASATGATRWTATPTATGDQASALPCALLATASTVYAIVAGKWRGQPQRPAVGSPSAPPVIRSSMGCGLPFECNEGMEEEPEAPAARGLVSSRRGAVSS